MFAQNVVKVLVKDEVNTIITPHLVGPLFNI